VDRPAGAPVDWVVYFTDPEIAQLALYQTFPDGWREARYSGRAVEPKVRDFPSLRPAVTVHLPNPGQNDVFLRLAGSAAPHLTGWIVPERVFDTRESLSLVGISGVSAFLAAMLVVNLVLFARTGLGHFAFYAIYLIAMIGSAMLYDGLLYRMVPAKWTGFQGSLLDDMISIVAAAALTQFGRLLLKLRDNAPTADRVVFWLILLVLASGLLQIAWPHAAGMVFHLAIIVSGIMLLALSLRFSLQGSVPARLFGMSYICVLIGFSVDVWLYYVPGSEMAWATKDPGLHSFMRNWAFHLGVLLETTLISLALTYFIRERDQEAEKARLATERMRREYESRMRAVAEAALTVSGKIEPDATPESADDRFLSAAMEVIDAHIGDAALDVAFLAKKLAMGEQTLRRRIRQITGLTPVAFIRSQRLEKARVLIESGACGSVGEVANAVGMFSASRFARQYREAFGQAPSEMLRGGGQPAPETGERVAKPV
jgi:methylphosphotriester-DNA--protein-cysteine methyltransferase